LAGLLKGELRVEIVGPGAVSETEWRLLDSIIANPTKLASLDSTNKLALRTLLRSLDMSAKNKAGQYIMGYQDSPASRQIKETKPEDMNIKFTRGN
jgi:hypothetical protein